MVGIVILSSGPFVVERGGCEHLLPWQRVEIMGDNVTKSRIVIIGTLFMLILMAVPETAFAYSSGKTNSTDGCGAGACHSSTSPTVIPSLTGLPSEGYIPGDTYSLTATASGGPGGSKGGFNMDSNLGTFTNPGLSTRISSGEVTHSNPNSRTWTVDWTAPSTGSGDVVFYMAVNLVNGDGGTSGDSWGADSWTVSEATSTPSPDAGLNNLGLNQPGSDSGSVFSYSALEIQSESPIIVLSNGSLVSFNSSGNSVISEDDVISKAGSCSILYNRTLRCDGPNNYGQLGLGSSSLSNGTVNFGNRVPVAISDGNNHNCAILDDASVRCWGRNNHGQIGDGSNINRNSPVPVDLGIGRTATSISAGNDFTCAVLDNGDVKCWGFNGYGNLGDGSTTSSNIPILANHSTGMRASSVSTPGYSTCSIFENGSISCWGKSYTVSTLNGPVTSNSSLIQLPSDREAVDIDGKYWHTCALLDNGSISCWGVNTNGQWGDGTCSSSSSACTGVDGNTPSFVLMATPAIAIATGPQSTCAINQSYSLYCWGGQSGEIDGSSDDVLTPHLMSFNNTTLGESVAFSDQDLDGDGIRNILDLNVTNDTDGDGFNSSEDDFPNNPARWTNCPDGRWGRLNCYLSPPGHYSLEGALFYSSCVAGTYQPEQGRTECYDSSAGYYVATPGSPNQQHCGPGYYQPSLAQLSCIPSPAGNYTNGQYGDADDAIPNPLQSRSATYLGQIGNLTWSNDTGDAFSIFAPRDTGLFVELTSQSDFSLSISNSSSVALATSNQSTSGGNTVSVTTNGTAFTNSSTVIVLITPNNSTTGNYTLKVGIFSTLDYSLYGNQSEIIDAEIQIGFFQCNPGTYQGKTGRSSCDLATPGRYVSVTGATSEELCISGTYQPLSGQSSCLSAQQGYYVPQDGASSQTPASPGNYVANSGSSSQTQCSPGYYQPSFAQVSCLSADPGFYVVSSGSSNQTACNPGTYQPSSGATNCIDTSPGHFAAYSNSTSQTPCSPGFYQPLSSQSSCLSAAPGHYVPGPASITQIGCDPGFYQPLPNQTFCLQATPGHYVPSNSSADQTPCDAGTYQPSNGSTECINASGGHYVDSPGSVSETPCPAGTYNPLESANSSSFCIDADSGHVVPTNGSSSQTPCTEGNYQPLTGQVSCIAASPGYFVGIEGATSETPCLPGFWGNQAGLSECIEASPGYYTDQNASTTQIPCPAGTYNPQTSGNSSSSCLDTAPGTYSSVLGASFQTPCSPGSYQPSTGQLSCIDVDPGFYGDSFGLTYQIECQPGEYQPLQGQVNCLDADPGYYVDSAMATSQIPCPVGTYNPSSASFDESSCLESDVGHFVSSPASPNQSPCIAGTFQNQTGQTSCVGADPGYHVPLGASPSQTPCSPGQYQPSPGQPLCLSSDPGYFTSEGSSLSQETCQPGTYQPSSGQTSCLDTDPGYFAPDLGQSEQIPAPLDQYVPSAKSSSTEPCPDKTITLSSASTSVDDCLLDSDGDRIHDEADQDDDGDGVNDQQDQCPLGLTGWSSNMDSDNDSDGCKDSEEDEDDDNDGFPDSQDDLPLDNTEWSDNDMDGIGDNSDTDDDNDGSSDIEEEQRNTSITDPDSDDDGFLDGIDDFPLDPTEWIDSDMDGVGDNGDDFPNDPDRQVEEDQSSMLIFVAIFTLVIVFGLVGILVVRKRGDDDGLSFLSNSVSNEPDINDDSTTFYSGVSVPNTKSATEDVQAEKKAISAPSDAKMNDNGQLVWVDDTGNVYCQNPDGSILYFDQLSGSWGPLENQN